jgi:SAM-dependent methyltransferase
VSYLMESPREAERLLAQEAASESTTRLLAAGLRSGDIALDAGCGAGAVTAVMAALVGERGRVDAVDLSTERLDQARLHGQGLSNVIFRQAAIQRLPFEAGTFDFVWSQYVLQYLPDRAHALQELIRVARAGGRIAIAEVDGAGLANWPFAPELELGYRKLMEVVGARGFDLFVGRKLFTMFKTLGLTQVKVNLYPQYVAAGAADAAMLHDWQIRLETLAEVATPTFGSVRAYREFAEGFLALLADDQSLKYAVQLVTVGRKP